MDIDVTAGLQNQLNVERLNAQKYFYIASVFANMAYDGFASFFISQGKGELEHAKMIEDFLISKRVQPEYKSLPDVMVSGYSVPDLAREAYRTELMTTNGLSALYQASEDAGESQVCAFLNQLLVEQIEEETWSADLADLVSRLDATGWTILDSKYGK